MHICHAPFYDMLQHSDAKRYISPGISVRAHGDGQRAGDALETIGLQEAL